MSVKTISREPGVVHHTHVEGVHPELSGHSGSVRFAGLRHDGVDWSRVMWTNVHALNVQIDRILAEQFCPIKSAHGLVDLASFSPTLLSIADTDEFAWCRYYPHADYMHAEYADVTVGHIGECPFRPDELVQSLYVRTYWASIVLGLVGQGAIKLQPSVFGGVCDGLTWFETS